MNRTEFARKFAAKFEISQEAAKEMCYAVFDTLGEELDKGEDIKIFNLGVFQHKTMKGKILRHPKTGELMQTQDRQVILFRRSTKKAETEEETEETLDVE